MAEPLLRAWDGHTPLISEARDNWYWLRDETAFDGFAWQILGPGHLARLGGPPPGARPLPGGRAELAVGPPEAWLPGPDDTTRPDCGEGPYPVSRSTLDPAVQDRARAALAGCLLTDEQAHAVRKARYGFRRQPERNGDDEADGSGGLRPAEAAAPACAQRLGAVQVHNKSPRKTAGGRGRRRRTWR